MLTGARAPVTLDLARSLKVAGYTVVSVDSLSPTITQFSSCIDAHYTVAKPSWDLKQFTLEIEEIIQKEKIDLLIPMCEEVLFLSKIRSQLSCPVFTMDFALIESLHNKWSFTQLLENYSLRVPDTWLIQTAKEMSKVPSNMKVVFKQIYSRFSANLVIKEKGSKLPNIEHDPKNPYIAQEFIEGEKLCSYSVAKKGEVTAYSEYKILQSIGIGAGISFVSTHHADIFEFVCRIVKKLKYTGQISFDFIRKSTGELYCIECNPRATSGLHLFDKNPDFSKTLVSKTTGCLFPKLGVYKRDILFSIWYGLKQGDLFSLTFWKMLFFGKSPFLWIKDIKPFFSIPYILFHIAKTTLLQKKGFHEVMSRDIEFNGGLS